MKQIYQDFELDLSDQDLTNEELARKLQEYTVITKLDIMSNQKLSDISPIRRFKELSVLNISDTAIVDLTPLKGFKNLTVFLADDTKITDISPLSDSTGLETLILTCTQVDNSVFQTLKYFMELRDLSLSYTKISGDISALSVLTNLKCLTLYETDIDASSLPKLNTLQKLTRLSVDPECEWAKKDLMSMLPSLKNSALKNDFTNSLYNIRKGLNNIELALQKNQIDAEQKIYIAVRLGFFTGTRKEVKTVMMNLSNRDLTNESLEEALKDESNICELNLSNNPRLTDLTPLKNLGYLEILDIAKTSVKDLSPLSPLPFLSVLNAQETQVSDISPIILCSNLRELRLTYTKVDNEIFNIVKKFISLEILCLSGTNVSGDVSKLMVMVNLKSLFLLNLNISANSLLHLTPLKNLTVLDVNPDYESEKEKLMAILMGLKNEALMRDIQYTLQYLDSQLNVIERLFDNIVFDEYTIKYIYSELKTLISKIRHIQSICNLRETQHDTNITCSAIISK